MRKRIFSRVLALFLVLSMLSTTAFAAVTFDVTYGGVTIDQTSSTGYGTDGNQFTSEDRDIIITGSYTEADPKATGSVITVGENVTDATITLKNVNIDASATGSGYYQAGKAAFSAGEGSNVTVELEGENTLKSGNLHAGLELNKGASITIRDAVKSSGQTLASLTAEGGNSGAGIGSGNEGKAGDITITDGANVNAVGGSIYKHAVDRLGGGAGIGSGDRGDVGEIKITNGATVTATALAEGAGIGSGGGGKGKSITIADNAHVTASSNGSGAGIGSGGRGLFGKYSRMDSIMITTGATVVANGGEAGSGIGTGEYGSVGDITITGGAKVTAHGDTTKEDNSAAGIGTGSEGNAGNILITGGADVTAVGNRLGPGIGYVGCNSAPHTGNITIIGAAVTATGGKYSTRSIHTHSSKSTITIVGNTRLDVTGTIGEPDWYSSNRNGNTEVRHFDKDGNLLYIHQPSMTNRIEYTITPPEGAQCEVDDDNYTVVIPAGSTAIDKNDKTGKPVYLVHGADIGVDGIIVEKAHTPGEPVEENRVAPQLGRAGSYDEVIYCTCPFCKEELKRIPHTIPALTETPSEDDNPGNNPGDTTIPDVDIPLGDLPTGGGTATTTIEDEETPLAGLFTRADAIGYLWEHTGSPEAELSDFEDVPEDHYWAVAIGWAQDMGIALPDEEGNFRPDDLVLRSSDEPEGELQEFLNRYAVFAGIELEDGELFIELEADADGIIMGEEAQVIFDEFFAKLEAALSKQAA